MYLKYCIYFERTSLRLNLVAANVLTNNLSFDLGLVRFELEHREGLTPAELPVFEPLLGYLVHNDLRTIIHPLLNLV